MTDYLMLAAGFVVLGLGGNFLVQGASALALRLGIPPLVVGLTVVGFGTSAPELAVNVSAALKGDSAIGFGNVVGSSIGNIGLILGLCALVRPLDFGGKIVSREVPMCILASLAALVLAADRFLGSGTADTWGRADGLMLLLIFCVFLYYTVADALHERSHAPAEDNSRAEQKASLPKALLLIVLGLVVLVGGAELTVRAAIAIARGLGIPTVVVGLTVVAIGTSLPELVTSMVATAKGHAGIAVGNILGSNIFNLLLIAGTSSTITDLDVPASQGMRDLLVMLAFTFVLLPLPLMRHRTLQRWQGMGLLMGYAAYIAVLVRESL